jgi:hypothetical protein
LKKKEVIAKRHGIRAFSLYVQIKIKQIFTRSRAKNLKELKKAYSGTRECYHDLNWIMIKEYINEKLV